MKYVFIIIALFCALTALTLYALWPSRQSIPEDTVVLINGQPLTRTAIQEIKTNETHHGSNEDLISEAITRQLLIAEAQRQGIDKENEFRGDLKTYYEHSLIKVLMERVEQDIHEEVSDAEIDTFLQAFGKTYFFTTLKTSKDITAEEIRKEGQQYSQPFDDLSSTMQLTLAIMHPGEISAISLTGNENMAIYLEKIEGESRQPPLVDRTLLKNELLQAKVDAQINLWIKDLRKKATITYTAGNATHTTSVKD